MNKQEVEHTIIRSDGMLDVIEIFDTIQGEGPYAGTPAVFIRLAGCNLQCPHCDTEYTRDRQHMTTYAISQIVQKHQERTLVVITGGEPFRQRNLGELVSNLVSLDYLVQLETNGTLFAPGPWSDVDIVCSPKTPKLNEKLLPYIESFKYVVDADNIDLTDGLPTCSMGEQGRGIYRPPGDFDGEIYIQPLDEKDATRNARNMKVAVESCLSYGYHLCLQIHKIAGLA